MTALLLTRIVSALGGLFSIFVVLFSGDFSKLALVALGLIFVLWAALPFGILFNQAHLFAKSASASLWSAGVLLLAALAITASAFAIYWQPFISRSQTDAQDGIVLVILPLYQLVFVGVMVGVAHLLARK